MSRRRGTENILTAYDGAVVAPGTTLLPEVSGILYSPKKLVLSTPGGTATVDLSHGPSGVGATPFLTVQVPATDTVCIPFPGGLDCPKGSGIHVSVAGGSVSVTLYHVSHDLTPGITKVASRAASFAAYNTQENQNIKAIRAPNRRAVGDKS